LQSGPNDFGQRLSLGKGTASQACFKPCES
jgi:hypothetical protein